ncbi:hypothetical protein VFA_002087 [Vibrio furnissii CIP 102972]|nr:hypothetical protein vfu_A02560 [Vibrio furnissii NCTC 11218]EEX42245.1 hypothetical protein VFA_002087 [Vibrio furnissii CIP 102972]
MDRFLAEVCEPMYSTCVSTTSTATRMYDGMDSVILFF